jgi:hypothetical protein
MPKLSKNNILLHKIRAPNILSTFTLCAIIIDKIKNNAVFEEMLYLNPQNGKIYFKF